MTTVEQYAALLARTDMPDREQARAVAYVATYGMDALDSPGCCLFRTPTCGDWDCIGPDHQVLSDTISPEEERARDESLGLHLSRRDRRAAKRKGRKP